MPTHPSLHPSKKRNKIVNESKSGTAQMSGDNIKATIPLEPSIPSGAWKMKTTKVSPNKGSKSGLTFQTDFRGTVEEMNQLP